MTSTYAVDPVTDRERIDVDGDQEAHRRWRDTPTNALGARTPLWVDVRRWNERNGKVEASVFLHG